jgi:phosphatidate phosphatase APP1
MKSANTRTTVWGPTLIALGQAALTAGTCRASEIKSDERVVFFPTAARVADDGQAWLAPIHGWIFEPEANSLSRRPLKAALRAAIPGETTAPANEILEQRLAPFLVDNERGKHVSIRVGSETYELPESQSDGHFTGEIRIPVATAQRLAADGVLRFLAVTDRNDDRTFAGAIHLIGPEGVSVISDIDDTVKITEVLDRQKLLENTFRRPFRPVAGMVELYRRWAGAGVRFHFVSNGPWQLYEPLQQFFETEKYPAATFDFRDFRLKDPSTLVSFLTDTGEAKLATIERWLGEFPRRRFVLIGDSGERDPETYGTIARKFPDRILRIFIRDVTGEAADAQRYQRAFAKLESTTWQLFQDPAQLRLP